MIRVFSLKSWRILVSLILVLTKRLFVTDFSPELESLIQSYVGKTVDDGNLPVWECLQCGKTSNRQYNIRGHVEAKHIEGLKLSCSVCQKCFKTRDSLRHHTRIHKDI